MQVFTSWSGGKDSCMALHRAVASGLKASHLINTVTEDGQRSRSHGLSESRLFKYERQQQAMRLNSKRRFST